MKAKKEGNSKKKRYLSPKINRHDVENLTSDWHYGMYGVTVAIPGGCSC